MHRIDVATGPLHLVMYEQKQRELFEKKQNTPLLPYPGKLHQDLLRGNQQGGLPATIALNKNNKKPQLHIYMDTYYLVLNRSRDDDCYTVAYIDLLNLHEHRFISRGVLLIHASTIQLHQDFQKGWITNYWPIIEGAWKQLEQQKRELAGKELQVALSHKHERYLDTINDLIELGYQFEQNKTNLSAGISYTTISSVGAVQEAPRDTYIFHLTDITPLSEKTMLRIREKSEYRGRVMSQVGRKVTIKFEDLIDYKLLPPIGTLELMPNTQVYLKQREAVQILREQESKNSRLLDVLVEQNYQPYQIDRVAQNSDKDLEELTREQFEAFRQALSVPDMLMVLGPPGTGKTKTITEIARYSGMRKKRVLITSGTHKAVDNVLARLPEDLIVIREGHESNISNEMKPKLIDIQATAMQEEIRKRIELRVTSSKQLLANKETIDKLQWRLIQGTSRLFNKEGQLAVQYQTKKSREEEISRPQREQFEQITEKRKQLEIKAQNTQQSLYAWYDRQKRFNANIQLPILGWFFNQLEQFTIEKIEQRKQALLHMRQEDYRFGQEQNRLYNEAQILLQQDQLYQQIEQGGRALALEHQKVWEDQAQIAEAIGQLIKGFAPQLPPLIPNSATTLQRYQQWSQKTITIQERQAKLLHDWDEELKQRNRQLYPELLRYADVVGATCIGTATARGLEDLEFDLVIVDEAGQIGLADLLVPLVRAKRAVLVGDHNQLPPFADRDLITWIDGIKGEERETELAEDPEKIKSLLTKSAFELLFAATKDPAHLVRFTRQGRMPQIIADFASQHFYQNSLDTFSAEKMGHTWDRDPLFRLPMVIIDTSNAPENLKWEREQSNGNEKGYINQAEAIIIADIAEVYSRQGKDWVVIVPYRAQARYIIQEMKRRINGDEQIFEERIATIDSFQGGERDKVIYGFTRSNKRGKIGFLDELRRLNVAMTRAKQQLVLVGNMAALTQAENEPFKNLLIDLREYVRKYGEYLSYLEYLRKVQQTTGGKKET